MLHDGEAVRCRIRGRLRLKGIRSTNPVVVGDQVTCESDDGGDYVICDICPRRNYVIRRASNLSKESTSLPRTSTRHCCWRHCEHRKRPRSS